MGAYGSPNLDSPDSNSYDYNYGYPGQHYKPYKPKHNFKGFFLWLFISIIIFCAIIFFINKYDLKTVNTAVSASSSVSASAPVSSSVINDSEDYLQSWAKAVVLECLVYPDTAKFSSNSADWKITRDGNECEITSIVMARGRKSKEIGKDSFVVKVTYDDLKAKVTYIKIGDNVTYDSSSSKSKK